MHIAAAVRMEVRKRTYMLYFDKRPAPSLWRLKRNRSRIGSQRCCQDKVMSPEARDSPFLIFNCAMQGEISRK